MMTRANSRPAYLIEPGDASSKREILAAALHLFVKEGLCETTIRAIGVLAGYTNPALYKFFPSKDALALHLFERCYLHVHDRIVASTDGVPYPRAIRAYADAWVELVEQDLEALLFVDEQLRTFWPKVSPSVRRRSIVRHMRTMVAPATGNEDAAVSLLLGTCGHLARRYFFEPHAPRVSGKALESLLLRGLEGGGRS